MSASIPLGFQLGSGDAVEIPIAHMAVTGQTQQSGKTTTLEALAWRSTDHTILAFVTKRGEGAFADGQRVQPYFRDRADWQFVTSIIDATLQEKNKFLRPWIMKVCRTTHSLADVQREVRKALTKAKGINEGVYTQLDEYLNLIVPEIRRAELAPELELRPGLNVMDLSAARGPMQMLFVQSAIDWVNEHERDTIVIVPEAWEFIPEGKGSPVKRSAIDLVRKGAAIGNFIWVDSQDMAGVDKEILRGCTVWLIGVQREANELKRNLSNIPKSIARPSTDDVAMLERGQFYACWGRHAIKTYVQPSWLTADDARQVALGKPPTGRRRPDPVRDVREFVDRGRATQRDIDRILEDPPVKESEARELRAEINQLRERNTYLTDELEKYERQSEAASSNHKAVQDAAASGRPVRGDAGRTPVAATAPVDGKLDDSLYQAIKRRLLEESESDPAILRVLTSRPEIQVAVERHTIEVDGDSLRGRIAQLIAEGFFDGAARAAGDVFKELQQRGGKDAVPGVGNELMALTRLGFFTRDNKWYRLTAGAKINLVEA